METDFTEKLYKIALDMYRYVHTDVWSGQRYYTTLNVAIISISFSALGALGELSTSLKPYFLVTVPLFSIGLVVSVFAYLSIRGLRKSFLQAIWFKILTEKALEGKFKKVFDEAGIDREKFQKRNVRWRLTPVYDMPDKDYEKALECKDLWINANIARRGGMGFYFMMLQGIFFVIDLIGLVLAIRLALF